MTKTDFEQVLHKATSNEEAFPDESVLKQVCQNSYDKYLLRFKQDKLPDDHRTHLQEAAVFEGQMEEDHQGAFASNPRLCSSRNTS